MLCAAKEEAEGNQNKKLKGLRAGASKLAVMLSKLLWPS
jgi:hypothetical protein